MADGGKERRGQGRPRSVNGPRPNSDRAASYHQRQRDRGLEFVTIIIPKDDAVAAEQWARDRRLAAQEGH
jgi:hypothetical protein